MESTNNANHAQKSQNDSQLSGIGQYDVLCGRHKLAFNNIGNRRLRVTVSLSLERYLAAPTRQDKTLVIISVVRLLQENGARFLKWKKDRWIELGEKQAREKVGHALRDMASARDLLPPSSTFSFQSSTKATSQDDQSISMLVASAHCPSNKNESNRLSKTGSNSFNMNDPRVECSAHFGCDVQFPVPLEPCFGRDISDGSLFMSLFEKEVDSLDESIFGSAAAPSA
jgi:hypothetical protein